MERSRGGSSTPSYKEETIDRGKASVGKVRGSGEEGETIMRSQMGPGLRKIVAQRKKRKKIKAREQGKKTKRDSADLKHRLFEGLC